MGLNRLPHRIQRITDINITIPLRRGLKRQLQSKEDDNRAKDQASIESSGRDVVVLLEPAEVLPPNIVLKRESNDAPAEVVVDACGRDKADAAEHDWDHEVAGRGFRPAAGGKPGEDGEDGAD